MAALNGESYKLVAEDLGITQNVATQQARRAMKALGLACQRDLIDAIFKIGADVVVSESDLRVFDVLQSDIDPLVMFDRKVVEHVADGLRNENIMSLHGVSESTVQRSITRLSKNFGLNSLGSAMSYRAVQIYCGQHDAPNTSVALVR